MEEKLLIRQEDLAVCCRCRETQDPAGFRGFEKKEAAKKKKLTSTSLLNVERIGVSSARMSSIEKYMKETLLAIIDTKESLRLTD